MKVSEIVATGASNVDLKTGVVYGFHYPNTAPYIHETMMNEGEDISYRDYRQSIIDELTVAIGNVMEKHTGSIDEGDAMDAAEQVFEDFISEGLECESYHWYMNDMDGRLELDLTESSLTVLKSPVIAWVAVGSPCIPNGGDLETPREENQAGTWAYCLPESFFEDEEYPYKVVKKLEDYLKEHKEEVEILGTVEKVLDHSASSDEISVLRKAVLKEQFGDGK